MKKILLALSLALVVAAPAFAIDDPNFANYVIKRGTGARQSEAVREVRLVRYGVQGNAGLSQTRDLASRDLVVWDTVSDDGVSVRMTATSTDGAIAGIVASATIQTADGVQNWVGEADGKRNWGWIVVSGKAVVNLAIGGGGNGPSVGDPFFTSRDTGTATYLEAHSNDAVADMRHNIRAGTTRGGFFFDAPTTGDASVEVYVQLN